MKKRVAFQGEHGAYSEAAAVQLFGAKAAGMPLPSFEAVFQAVKDGRADHAVVPIENSLAGSIHQNYDLMQDFHLQITAETYVRIEHILMGGSGTTLKNLTEVRSHPQALSQCSHFFRRHRRITPYAFYDTAGAAKYVAEQRPAATGAIASLHASRIYGLKVLGRNLENDHRNFTRFLALARGPGKPVKGPAKTSLCFTPRVEESGVLFRMLGVFALRQINLLKIESRPIPGRTFEYLFYLDLEGRATDARVAAAIDHLREMASQIKVLGSYPAAGKVS